MELEKQMESKLEREGWCLQEQVVKQTLEQLLQSGGAEEETRSLDGALRTELLDTDIKRIGARSLPDLQALLHTRVLQGLRVLQILSVTDISQSSKRATTGGNQQSRLLRFRLTDGHTTVTALEFHPIPSVSQDLPPGTKRYPVSSTNMQLTGNLKNLSFPAPPKRKSSTVFEYWVAMCKRCMMLGKWTESTQELLVKRQTNRRYQTVYQDHHLFELCNLEEKLAKAMNQYCRLPSRTSTAEQVFWIVARSRPKEICEQVKLFEPRSRKRMSPVEL